MENADLHKPVLKKIMTTEEQYVKQDFVAPLTNEALLLDLLTALSDFFSKILSPNTCKLFLIAKGVLS